MESTAVIQVQDNEPVDSGQPSRPRVEEPFALVIFGATGVLTAGKLLPALFRLWQAEFLSLPFAVVGVGRREKDDAKFRASPITVPGVGVLPKQIGC